MTESERMLNLGKQIHLKYIGDVTVTEPSLESVIRLANEIASIAAKLEFGKNIPPMQFVMLLIQDDETLKAVKKLAASLTKKEAKDFDGMGISDWMRLIATVKEVVDWEELKELFTQTGLTSLWSQVRPDVSVNEPLASSMPSVIPTGGQ